MKPMKPMKAGICALLALLALAMTPLFAFAETLDFPLTGFTYEAPDGFFDTLGQMSADGVADVGEPLGYNTGLLNGYLLYTARSDEEFAPLQALADGADEYTDEVREAISSFYAGRNFQVFEVYGLSSAWTMEKVIETGLNGDDPYAEKIPLGECGGFSYYLMIYNFDHPLVAEYLASWPPEMAEDLRRVSQDVAAHPERITLKERTVSFVPPEIGSAITFETEDLNGNPVNSAALFGNSQVTLVNIWRTWCAPCVEEMPELDEISRAFAERGGQVVTFCADAGDAELTARAKEIAGAYSFLTLVSSDSIAAALPFKGTPMTYFVDGEGRVLAYPILGADPDAYRASMEAFLSGKAPEETPAAAEEEGESASYIITVLDQNGDPVPGVFINFCTATTCAPNRTDADGVISFEGEAQRYHLTVLKVPKGYSFVPSDDIYTEDHACSVTLTVTKE